MPIGTALQRPKTGLRVNTRAILKNLVVVNLERLSELRHFVWKARLKEKPVLREPVFIIGCPRSGTSIFAELFGTHPLVANWSEAGRIWDPVEGLNPEADHCWDKERVDRQTADRLHSLFEWYRQAHGKQRFVNKHPRNSVRIGFLEAIFPDAFYIHIVRDGRAVVHSIIKEIEKSPLRQKIPFGNFCKPPDWRAYMRNDLVEQTSLQWREIVRYIVAHESDLGDRYLRIKYEDVCRHPQEAFASAFAFAGLPASSRDLMHIPETMETMNYKYKSFFSPSQIDTITRIQRDTLVQLGYDL